MKPAPFDLLTPSSIDEALAMLAEHGPDARPLAGGQSLVPMMNFRLARPAVLVDLNRVPGLGGLSADGGRLAIGAMTRQRALERSALARRLAPLLHEATGHVAHLPVRSRGTIGGSLALADPAAEYPAAVLALDAELAARSVRGERRVRAADFFDGALSTTLADDELLVGISVPAPGPGSGFAFVEIARRRGDFALAGVAARIALDGGRVADVGLAACGVGPGPVRLAAAEKIVREDGVSGEAVKAAADAGAARDIDPQSDVHAPAGYRRRLARVLIGRALETAAERARSAA